MMWIELERLKVGAVMLINCSGSNVRYMSRARPLLFEGQAGSEEVIGEPSQIGGGSVYMGAVIAFY